MTSIDTHTPAVLRFVALRRSVADPQRAVAFYCGGLGFSVAGKEGASGETVLALGAERIVLIGSNCGAIVHAPGPDVRFQHVAIVTSDMSAAFNRLQKETPVAISRGGPQRLPAASGGVCAFKFRDPDGHPLELIEFPPGQGAAHWNAAAPRDDSGPTLGIDHAAISVSNADRSIAFYEQLGFRLDARQINRGPEQARLDGLADVEVEVVALVPCQASTPHLELLAYRTPEPSPGGSDRHKAAADRLVWQARAPRGTSSPIPDGHPHSDVADPDGHLNRILQ